MTRTPKYWFSCIYSQGLMCTCLNLFVGNEQQRKKGKVNTNQFVSIKQVQHMIMMPLNEWIHNKLITNSHGLKTVLLAQV